jgi:hypothetical protein
MVMGFLIPDHLGPVQMTTDTALGVTKRVIVDRCGFACSPHPFFPPADRLTVLYFRGDCLVPFEEIPYVARRLSHTHDWVRRLLTLTSDVDFSGPTWPFS